jgi:hypothetical protein
MKNYITKEQMENGKTYNKLVSVVVRLKNENKYYEYLPCNKSQMLDVIYRFNLKSEIISIEIVKEYYALKSKWN